MDIGDLLNVPGSPVHLTKTVMNLVSNSAEKLAKAVCKELYPNTV